MKPGAVSELPAGKFTREQLISVLFSPPLILFVSANLVNVGNLAFNILFSRWLGPELFSDLAFLLTIKLSILCLLSAVQFEIAARAARAVHSGSIHLASQQTSRLLGILLAAGGCIFLAGAASALLLFPANSIASDSNFAFVVFAICLPFMAPLCMARGLSQGQLDLKHIVLSAQVEMAVRLAGSILAWYLGLGLPGVALAIALSIIAGWWFAVPPPKHPSQGSMRKQAETPGGTKMNDSILGNGLLVAALPWACLQLGQVLVLDGDFLVSKFLFTAEQSGHSAVAILVQRILFFGSFGLASAVLPMVANATSKRELMHAIAPILVLLAVTIVPFIALVGAYPKTIVAFVFGDNYIETAPALIWSSISGACFVVIYLLATVLMAMSKRKIGYVVLATSILIIATLVITALTLPEVNVLFLIKLKAVVLGFCTILFAKVAWHEFTSTKPN